jgi:uncharacterized repeat protein (TIGR01451 family)
MLSMRWGLTVGAAIAAAVLATPQAGLATHQPDLSVDIYNYVDTSSVGQPLPYGVTVYNRGFSDAPNVTVTVAFSSPVVLVEDSEPRTDTRCRQQRRSGDILCRLGKFSAGQGQAIAVVVAPQTPGELTATATVDASADDPEPDNDTDVEHTTIVG